VESSYFYVYFTSAERWQHPGLRSMKQDHGALERHEGGLRFRGLRTTIEMPRVQGLTLSRNGSPWRTIVLVMAIMLAGGIFEIMAVSRGMRMRDAGLIPWFFLLTPLLLWPVELRRRYAGDWVCIEYSTDGQPVERAYFRESTSGMSWWNKDQATITMYEQLRAELGLDLHGQQSGEQAERITLQ
jgi:hypothetical protein